MRIPALLTALLVWVSGAVAQPTPGQQTTFQPGDQIQFYRTGNILFAPFSSLVTDILTTPNTWLAPQTFSGGALVLTVPPGTNDTQPASTEFVQNAISNAFPFVIIPASDGDGIKDTLPAFNAALAKLGATGGTIIFPPGRFCSSMGYSVPSNISLVGAGRTATTLCGNNAAPFPFNTTLIVYGTLTGTGNFGSINPTTYAINAATQGASQITTTNPSDAGNFSAGMDILISGSLHGTSFWYPDWLTNVVSANPSTGVITLSEPLPLSGTSPTSQSTVTITIAAPGVITWTAHGRSAGDGVAFSNTGGALPTGIVAGTMYYVANDGNLTTNTFDVSPTVAQALAGTGQITTIGSQSGTQSAALGVLTLVQQIVGAPQNIKVSDLTIEGGGDGSVQVALTHGVTFDNVEITPGSGLGDLSIVAARNLTVSNSFFSGGSYLECLGCFYFNFVGNQLPNGSIAIDGGSQYGYIGYNDIPNPGQNGAAAAGIQVFSMAQYNAFVGNNITNVRHTSFGIQDTGINGEGNNFFGANNISCIDNSSEGIAINASIANTLVGDNIVGCGIGVGLANNATAQNIGLMTFNGVATQYNVDATSGYNLPITPYARGVRSNVGATVDVTIGTVAIFNSAAQNISALSSPTVGQIVTVQFGDGNSSLIQSGNLNLLQATSFLSIPSGTIMQFQQLTVGSWTELSRTQVNVAAIVDVRGRTVNGLLTASGGLSVTGAISGAGVTSLFASPPPIGGTAPAAGAFTTMTATSAAPTVSPGQIGYGGTIVSAGTGNCPSTMSTSVSATQAVEGCIVVNIAGTARNIPLLAQ